MHSPVNRRPYVRPIPFDMGAAASISGWREQLEWPVGIAETRALLEKCQRAVLEWLGSLDEATDRRVALLAAPRCVSIASVLLEASLLIQAEGETPRLAGGPAELGWLRGQGDMPPAAIPRVRPSAASLRALFSRRIARTASWTPWWRLPAALLRPTAIAVSHNGILREAAARGEARVAFRHGDPWLERIRQDSRSGDKARAVELSHALATHIAAIPDLYDATRTRLRALLLARFEPTFVTAASDLATLASVRDLPRILWSGAASNQAARAIGLEVMRRGGDVIRFDHGGSIAMADNPDPLTMRETSASTGFVASTSLVAEQCQTLSDQRPVEGLRLARIEGAEGEPAVRGALHLPSRPLGARPRVVYATGAIYGFRQLTPPILRDPIYVDWQMRLASTLHRCPIDFTIRPHPEGIYFGRRHPLADIKPCSTEPFESLMASSDLFVFDFPMSTAFSAALCSDRPIVLVDLGLAPFHPKIRPLIEQRCRVVKVHWSEKNIPEFDHASLEAAIFSDETPDPMPFRRLLAGVA